MQAARAAQAEVSERFELLLDVGDCVVTVDLGGRQEVIDRSFWDRIQMLESVCVRHQSMVDAVQSMQDGLKAEMAAARSVESMPKRITPEDVRSVRRSIALMLYRLDAEQGASR